MSNNQIVTYTEHITIRAKELIEDGCGDSRDVGYPENLEAFKWNDKHYKGASCICPFCKTSMRIALERPAYSETNTVWQCQKCGWWELERVFRAGGVQDDVAYAAIHHQACVKNFAINSSKVPTEALVDHLQKRPDIVYSVNKKKMEEIVQYVFSDFYECEVTHVGKSHDGGVDLIMIDADEPTLIQVKCRESKNAIEPISQIREFLGVMWINQSKKGAFMSTADHFSSVSVNTINEMLSKGLLRSFDLIDFKRFVEMLKAIKSPKETIWEMLLGQPYDYIIGDLH
ncbi:MAG: hypothetical protein C4519_13905 [Desulfobacteraceae bacterium]|nr:MAG: hypothetical protein C4519_13905 [Desulfobacteraceae bacterium]